MKLILLLITLYLLSPSLLSKDIEFLNISQIDALKHIEYTKEERAYLKQKRVIKMCVDPDWMPFEKIEDGRHIGLASDYMRVVSLGLGIPIELVVTSSWSESIEKAKRRECDIFSMVPITKRREKYMDFTTSYLDIPIVLVTQIDKQFIDNIQNIQDKKIGVVKNYTIATKLKERYPNINIVDVESIYDGLSKVKDGEIFAFIDNLITINYEIQKSFIGEIKVSSRLDERLYYRVATRSDEPKLHSVIQKVIDEITADIKQKIFCKWIPIVTKKQVDYILFMQIIIVFSIFLLISIFFIFREHRLKEEILKLNIELEDRVKRAIEKNKYQQAMMFHQSRLAQMGEMIGMIAHQWRQPLTAIGAIVANIQIRMELKNLDNKTTSKATDSINNYIQHLSSTIDDFRNFFKPNIERREITYTEVINESLSIIELSLKNKNIDIITLLECKESFYTHSNEIKQVILNLLKNSEDAIVESGVSSPYIKIETYSKGECYILELSDNGGGIPKSIIDNIFDPYFSTKSKSNGTGLGLYMSKIIIEEHCGGKLEVFNTQDGVLFRVELVALGSS